MFDSIIAWSLKNRLLVVAAYITVFLFGLYRVQRIGMDVLPEFAPPQVVIQTEAPGLSPEDMETLITFRIETAINGTPGVDVVRSKSSAGLSTVIVVFNWGTDIYTARQLVNERLQEVRDQFPPGTEAPEMLPITSAVSWLLKFSLQSDKIPLTDLRTLCDWDIRNRLLAIQGVASAVCMGSGSKQYQVLLSSPKLLQYGITVREVVEALQEANRNVPGGFHLVPGQEYVVTGVGRITSLDDLKKTVIAEREGTPIPLDRVAEIRFGAEFPRGDSASMGEPAVIGTVSKLFGAGTLQVTYKTEEALEQIRKTLPEGVKLDTHVFRQADFIEASVENLRQALLQGAIIVCIVVFFFLFNVRASLITLTAMPLSLLLGILVLQQFGVGINAMTLGGLAVAIGAVVDDAIIDVENIFRRLRENRLKTSPEPTLKVVFDASREIRIPIVYATLIILVVFGPIFFFGGVEGRIFTPLGLAFTTSLLVSLLVSMTLTPVLCSFFLTRGRGRKGALEQESGVIRTLKAGYGKVLTPALKRPGIVIAAAAALLVAALVTIPLLGRSFLPEFHEGTYILAVTSLPGTSLQESMRLGYLITRRLRSHPEVVSVSQRAGRAELDEDAMPPNFMEFDIRLRYEKRNPDEVNRSIREDLEQIPGVSINLGQFIAHRLDEVLSGVRAQIAIKIYGPDLDQLLATGQQVQGALSSIRGVTDLQLEQQVRVPEVRIKVNRERAARLGLNAGDVLETAQIAFNGETISQVIEGQKSFDLFLWFGEAARRSTQAMSEVLVDGHEGQRVPLSQVAEVGIESRPYFINRERVQRRIAVQANVTSRDLGSVIAEAQTKIAQQVNLPAGYFVEYGGQFQSQQEATRILLTYGAVAVVFIFLLLFMAFNSTNASLLIMANLPLALIGGVMAIYFTGRIMSVPSLIGLVTVLGIAARNGIILMTHYRNLRAEGFSREQVVVEGSKDRLAPVLMTAAAAALGLLPLLFGGLAGKELERPMAYVILGGLFTSTLLNMIVVPVLFMKYGWEKEEVFVRQLATGRGELLGIKEE